ncbi:hypothetical protein [Sorangium sp. So ce363]|uniref:hypothetical protein n=1 Tax=Sorangium sp. So ce363 TaxID=3133304 RepID=UPI003F5EF5DF
MLMVMLLMQVLCHMNEPSAMTGGRERTIDLGEMEIQGHVWEDGVDRMISGDEAKLLEYPGSCCFGSAPAPYTRRGSGLFPVRQS